MDSRHLRDAAYELLDGYGDAQAGEWTEDRPRAFHLRRRLTLEEAKNIGPAVDCRRTPEAMKRFSAMKAILPEFYLPIAIEELES